MSFQDKNQKISLKVEVDFDQGAGWEDFTKNLNDISIIQDTFSDSILGLFTTEIEVRFVGLEPDTKWQATNIKVRGFVTSNGVQKQLFNGLSKGSDTLTPEEVVLTLVNEPEKGLNTDFGDDATDLVEYKYDSSSISLDRIDMSPDSEFLPSGELLEPAFGSVLTLSLNNTNWRPGLGLQPLNQSIRCNALINKKGNNDPGIYTTDQMLKAIGLLGGYGADGSGFQVKQGYHYTGSLAPVSQFDLRDVQIYNSFKTIDNDTEYNFNTFKFSGKKFQYRRRGKNPLIEDIKPIKIAPSSGVEIDGLNNEVRFLNIENKILCDLKKGFTRASATTDGESGSPTQNVQLTIRANDRVYDFTGLEIAGPRSNPYLNFFSYRNSRDISNPIEFAISFRIRPVDDGRSTHTAFNTTNNVSGNSTAVYVDLREFNKSIRFRYRRSDNSQIAYSSISNAFEWDEWQTITVVVANFDNGNRVAFWNNDTFISDTSIDTNIFTNIFLSVTTPDIRGRMAALTVYDLNPTFLIPTTFDLDVNSDQATNRSDSSNPYPGVVCYFPMDGGGFNFSDRINNEFFSLITNNWTTSLLDEDFRAKNDSNLNVLANYSGDNFTQTLTYRSHNLDGGEAVIEEFRLYPQSSYTLLKDFTVEKTNASSSEAKILKESRSFYLNSEDTGVKNADFLAQSILNVFDNGLGVFDFSVFLQPDLDVGDIVTFNIYENNEIVPSVGVVLKKKTFINKFELIDALTVKKLRNLA